MGDIGILEIFFLLIIGILIFGGDLPEVGRKLGRAWSTVQNYFNTLKQELYQENRNLRNRVELDDHPFQEPVNPPPPEQSYEEAHQSETGPEEQVQTDPTPSTSETSSSSDDPSSSEKNRTDDEPTE